MRLFKLFLVSFAFSMFIISCASKPEPAPVGVEEVQDQGPEEPLLHSLIADNNNKELSEMFNMDMDVNQKDSLGRTPLHIAAIKGNTQMIERLLLYGALVDAIDNDKKTPLILAIENSQYKGAAILVKNLSDIFLNDKTNKSASDYALNKGLSAIESIITEKNIDTLNSSGNTILHIAAKKGLGTLVDFLIEKGANVNKRNSDGDLALDISLENKSDIEYAKVSEALISAGSSRSKYTDFSYIYTVFQLSDYNIRDEYGKTPLHKASELGHEGFVKLFLANDANLDIRDKPGNTALHEAVRSGYINIVRLLLEKGADVNAEDFNENTPLHVSLSVEKNTDIAKLLIEKGADINSKNSFGNTPLHLTVSLQETKDMAQILIDNGAYIDSRNKSGNTPLMLAVEKEHKEIAQLLLSKGADIYAVNINQKTPVETALDKGYDVINWLITDKNINKSDNSGNTILHLAIILVKDLAVINQLLEIGAIPDIRNMQGNTPLHEAVLLRETENSIALLTAGSSLYITNNAGESPLLLSFKIGPEFIREILTHQYINKPDSMNNTPLFYAINWSTPEMVSILISLGAEINIRNMNGSTPLHEVVRSGSMESAEILIENGADLTAVDSSGNTALHEVVFWDALDVGNLLLVKGADIDAKNNAGRTAMQEAVNLGRESVVDFFLQRGANINTTDNTGKTPLFDASITGYYDIVKLLIDNKASLSRRDDKGNTILHVALIAGHKEISQLLIKNNSDIFALNRNGNSPLSIAMAQGKNTLNWFISDENINAANNDGMTPLHFAVKFKSGREIISYLIERGADINTRNANGQTPADYAREDKYTDVLDLLK
ncbi:MAG: ankyrin repeat domain-containing protein [Spirochaetaceae bacterium]|jgi:ankyrin repeat protein|nr:ankyrin repeat domain-containing protein [Spirochaetaceae bacterium]